MSQAQSSIAILLLLVGATVAHGTTLAPIKRDMKTILMEEGIAEYKAGYAIDAYQKDHSSACGRLVIRGLRGDRDALSQLAVNNCNY